MEAFAKVRAQLFRRLVESTGPEDWLRLQYRVAAAILRAERARVGADKSLRSHLKWHIERLRSLTDAVAWRCMDGHAIRQYSTLAGRAPHLGGLKEQLQRYLRLAAPFVEVGLPCVVPDLTNMLRLGDLMVVVDPSAPEVVEVKGEQVLMPAALVAGMEKLAGRPAPTVEMPSPYRPRGRQGRQMSQMIARHGYLRDDRGRFPSDDFERVAFTVDLVRSRQHADVDEVVGEALRVGSASKQITAHDVVLAVAAAGSTKLQLSKLDPAIGAMRAAVLGMNLTPTHDAWWSTPPPTEWSLSRDSAWALFEGDVVLAHVIDLAAFEELSTPNVRFSVTQTHGRPAIAITTARIDEGLVYLGDRFIWDVLYGFESIESVGTRAVEFVEKALSNWPGLPGAI